MDPVGMDTVGMDTVGRQTEGCVWLSLWQKLASELQTVLLSPQ